MELKYELDGLQLERLSTREKQKKNFSVRSHYNLAR